MSIATYASRTLNIYITKDDLDILLHQGNYTVEFAIGGKVIIGCKVIVILDEITRKVMITTLSKERKALHVLKPKTPRRVKAVKIGAEKEGILYAPSR